LALTLEVGPSASALFVDYGQAAASSEAKASAAIASHFGVDYQSLSCTGRTFGAGEIRGRNAFLAQGRNLRPKSESPPLTAGHTPHFINCGGLGLLLVYLVIAQEQAHESLRTAEG
jgi:hypothetical protein